MNKIKWIIDGYSYWDKTNGNSYPLTRITRTSTGKSAVFDECEGNMRHYINQVEKPRNGYFDQRLVHVSPIQDIPCKEWRKMLNSEYYAPVSQYERKGKHNVNVTARIIRSLSRTD